jgi:glutamine phosphoribosylpyrophosphate amidotransferase
MSAILGVFSDHNVIPSLFKGLETMQLASGEHDGVSLAALTGGRIQQRQFVKRESVYPEKDLSYFLEKQNLSACLSLVCLRHKKRYQQYHVHLATTSEMAVAYHGYIDNLPDIREELLQLGYELDSLCPSQLILRFIHRYLDIGFSIREANLTAIKRLKGEFGIIALFANPQSLVIGQRGVPMTLGIKENTIYIASSPTACFVEPSRVIEEDSLLILRSSKKCDE